MNTYLANYLICGALIVLILSFSSVAIAAWVFIYQFKKAAKNFADIGTDAKAFYFRN
jgi:hypothetical protein